MVITNFPLSVNFWTAWQTGLKLLTILLLVEEYCHFEIQEEGLFEAFIHECFS